jgi:recombinational DNA repair ATPase RecF
MDKEYIQSNAGHFKYLFRLQASGKTNMFGAAAYLQTARGINKEEAKTILLYWMENYEAIATELGVEV